MHVDLHTFAQINQHKKYMHKTVLILKILEKRLNHCNFCLCISFLYSKFHYYRSIQTRVINQKPCFPSLVRVTLIFAPSPQKQRAPLLFNNLRIQYHWSLSIGLSKLKLSTGNRFSIFSNSDVNVGSRYPNLIQIIAFIRASSTTRSITVDLSKLSGLSVWTSRSASNQRWQHLPLATCRPLYKENYSIED